MNLKSKTLCLYFQLHQPIRLNLPTNFQDLLQKSFQNLNSLPNSQNPSSLNSLENQNSENSTQKLTNSNNLTENSTQNSVKNSIRFPGLTIPVSQNPKINQKTESEFGKIDQTQNNQNSELKSKELELNSQNNSTQNSAQNAANYFENSSLSSKIKPDFKSPFEFPLKVFQNSISSFPFDDFCNGPSGDNPDFLYGNSAIFDKVATTSYIPTLKFWLTQMEKLPNLKLTLGLSGTFLEQVKKSQFGTEILALIRQLLATGKLEIMAETYYHSLASLLCEVEFGRQVGKHNQILQRLFDYKAVSFRNTELIFNVEIGQMVTNLNYQIQIISQSKNLAKNLKNYNSINSGNNSEVSEVSKISNSNNLENNLESLQKSAKLPKKLPNLAILGDQIQTNLVSNNSVQNSISNSELKPKLKLALANFDATMFFFFTHRSDEFKKFFANYEGNLEVLGTDFEIFGEHNGSHIFEIWKDLLRTLEPNWNFVNVRDLLNFEEDLTLNSDLVSTFSDYNSNSSLASNSTHSKLPIYQEIFQNRTTSWTNSEQSLISWLGNPNQDKSFEKLGEIYTKLTELSQKVKDYFPKNQKNALNSVNTHIKSSETLENLPNSKNQSEIEIETNQKTENQKINLDELWDFFGKLTTSDNFYYMSDLGGDDGPLHAMFNAYPSPQIAFETFWQILEIFENLVDNLLILID